MRQYKGQASVAVFSMVLAVPVAHAVVAFQVDALAQIEDEAPEPARIDHIRKLDGLAQARSEDARLFAVRSIIMEQAVKEIDDLFQRFPETSFREDASILKLKYLATLARVDAKHLTSLLAMTEQIALANPHGRLAVANDYYAIQAFVLGARYEDMPDDRRQLGAVERYEAFLRDHPSSDHVPVIRASLVRNLIAMNRLDRAREVVADLKRVSPDHRAVARATGELRRVTAVGKPFSFTHSTPDGRTIRTDDYHGKVLIVHFWATSYERSIRELAQLADLDKRFHEKGLAMVGVNIDKDRAAVDRAIETHRLTWPQYFDEKGYGNDVLVSAGVIQIPTYFVLDRRGVLRSIDPGVEFESLVESLLAEQTDSGKGD